MIRISFKMIRMMPQNDPDPIQNYPNPFNPQTNISFDVLKDEIVSIIIYDAIGREVETLLDEKLSPT